MRSCVQAVLLWTSALCVFSDATIPVVSPDAIASKVSTKPRGHHARLPVRFEQNLGQTDERVRFVARAGRTTLFLGADGATLAQRGCSGKDDTCAPAVVRMKVRGGRDIAPIAEQELVTRTNYFLGNDPSRWRTDVPNFGRVRYPHVRDGVDLVFHGEDGQLEYDFVVAPGVDSSGIALDIEGSEKVSLTSEGALSIKTEAGVFVHPPPRVYQREPNGATRDIAAAYRLVDDRAVGFVVAAYDRSRELVIDPVLGYVTHLGGSGAESAQAVAVDGSGCAYVTGSTASVDFPTTLGAFQRTWPGVFITKLNAAGNALLYSTYLGGSSTRGGSFGIAVDAMGNAYVVGETDSADFPTMNPLQAVKGTGALGADAFVTKLNATGNALVYSTFLGGNSWDIAFAVAIDASGSAYVTGRTYSTDFPTTQAAFQPRHAGGTVQDGFVAKLSASGDALVYSTYLGGTSHDDPSSIAVDPSGSAYVSGITHSLDFPTKNAFQPKKGYDNFVTKLTPSGDALDFSTYLGGTNGLPGTIAVDPFGHAYVSGKTGAKDFPTPTPKPGPEGELQAFILKFSVAGTSLDYGFYLGNSGPPLVVVDDQGSAYFAMGGSPALLKRPFQAVNAGGADPFFVKLNANGSAIVYASYAAGTSFDEHMSAVALGPRRTLYAVGEYASRDAAEWVPPSIRDMFVLRVDPTIDISPTATATTPRGPINFTAVGDNAGATYSLKTNASGGTIHPATGAYVAGATANVSDEVQVTDNDGYTAFATVAVGPGVRVLPPTWSTPAFGTKTFAAVGGSNAGYTFALSTNVSGATIGITNGVYQAGSKAGSDVIRATDSLGNTGTAIVEVAAAPLDAGAADAGPGQAKDGGAGTDPVMDAGPDAQDANTPSETLGGSGCTCRTSATTSTSAPWWVAVAAAVALARRKRRAN